MRTALILLALLSVMLMLSCEDCETCPDGYPVGYEFALFRIDSTWLPSSDADMLTLSVTGPGVIENSWNIYKKDMPVELQIVLADSAEWLLSLEAWNSNIELLVAEAEKSFSQPLGMELLDLDWQINPDIIALYTFEDPWLYGWGGTAYTSLNDGLLQLSSTGQTAWYYHIFDHSSIGEFPSIVAQFDLLFEDNNSYMGLRAHASDGWLDWGPEVLFHEGNIIAHLHEGNDTTQTTYETNTWYCFRLTADNNLGDVGRYRLEIKEKDAAGYIDLGEYNYFAYRGRPIDLVEIAFGVNESTSGQGTLSIDNVVILEP